VVFLAFLFSDQLFFFGVICNFGNTPKPFLFVGGLGFVNPYRRVPFALKPWQLFFFFFFENPRASAAFPRFVCALGRKCFVSLFPFFTFFVLLTRRPVWSLFLYFSYTQIAVAPRLERSSPPPFLQLKFFFTS